MGTRRSVADRLISLKPASVRSQTTLNMAEIMLRGLEESEDICCTVDRHCRTRIFDFPGAQATESLPCLSIYECGSVRASLVADLGRYFEESKSLHYAISPPLRHEVNEKRRKFDAQGDGKFGLFGHRGGRPAGRAYGECVGGSLRVRFRRVLLQRRQFAGKMSRGRHETAAYDAVSKAPGGACNP